MSPEATRVAAVDLGATSGRVMVADRSLRLAEVARFPTRRVPLPDGLQWDAVGVFADVVDGLRSVGDVTSVGVDSWGVDYGLLDEQGSLVGNPFHYRDDRTSLVTGLPPHSQLFVRNGLQDLPFTTLRQLVVEHRRFATLLLIPDLLVWWLTGVLGTERTNASTTGLLDPATREWSPQLLALAGISAEQLAPLRDAGEKVGPLRKDLGLTGVLTTVGSHDTASAVVGIPAEGNRFAYVCTGTWALAGVELTAPLLSETARTAGFTNELGVDGRVRFLRNEMGFWLLEECAREPGWQPLAECLERAQHLPPSPVSFDVNDPSLAAPGPMAARIRALADADLTDPIRLTRCVLDSLALGYARAVREAAAATGRDVDVVHLVGGGARVPLLCQRVADLLERPVQAGPVEATATGNALVQLRAHGAVLGDLDELRAYLRRQRPPRIHRPQGART